MASSSKHRNFNPRSPRGERLLVRLSRLNRPDISIHAPRGGSDLEDFDKIKMAYGFQSTLPAGGATIWEREDLLTYTKFQSTLPAGGATCAILCVQCSLYCISIHAPRGGSDLPFRAYCLIWNISIHAPRGGSDGAADGVSVYLHLISIHAPRGGSDQHLLIFCPFPSLDFNPRSPRGERPADRCVYRPD